MLKIKGLKKKKKGKKGKHKEEELFDSAELEQYRQKLEAREAEGAGGEASSAEQSDEWQRFKALTAGVDSVLKKTQDDLDRIKTTSYFQKKSTKPDKEEKKETVEPLPKAKSKKWVGFEEGAVEATEEEENTHKEEEATVESVSVDNTEAQHFSEEEEEESDKDEDLFDTSYVDVVASGEVKLAYIPDSPDQEDDGFDPFDTSIVDTVIKVDPKKNKLVSLGCAVDVLTGRVEKPTCVDFETKKRRRPRKQDLLLGSFDEGDVLDTSHVSIKEDVPVKTILDEEPDIVVDEIDLSINLATILPIHSPALDIQERNKVEFALEATSNQEYNANSELESDDDLDDEFAALAAESLLKTTCNTNEGLENFQLENSEQNNTHSRVLSPTAGYSVVNKVSEFDIYEESDPFDTTFASNILPGKCELKLIEEEILLKNHEFKTNNIPSILENFPSINIKINDSSFNEHNFLDEDQTPLSYKHRDLLGGSTTDLSKIGHSPIEPAATKEQEIEISYVDPFDTSVVDVLVAPGKAELKFLEKELLDEGVSDIQSLDNDDNFDPRADSPEKICKPLVRPDQLPVGEKRLSIPKVVAFNIDSLKVEQDLLAVGEEEESKITKPLTPYYADTKDIVPSFESENSFVDPFDTSFVSHNPGKVELKLIESELVGSDLGLKRSVSDQDFNPRSDGEIESNVDIKLQNPVRTIVVKPLNLPVKPVYGEIQKLRPDILSEEEIITTKLHTPVLPRKIEEDINDFGYSDPFDTSVVDTLVAPGKAELKLLESELIHSVEPVSTIKRSYTDQDFNPRNKPEETLPEIIRNPTNYIDHTTDEELAEKPLTPQSANSKVSFGIGEDIDPFDTSCVDNLVPGKVELKLLESELIHN